ncbi:GNAT family N-acetyltransferase [bacterium]|nr:GNAT family N-acetyltransferase [bacterium]
MIRLANKYDKTQLQEMIRMFRDESPIEQYKDIDNPEYFNSLIDSIIVGKGVIFIEENIGFIMGIITPTIWCDKTFAMYELAWYVKPEYRMGMVGIRLLKEYINYANQLKEQGRIKLFTVTKMITSPNLDYSRFGFKKIEENWMQ